MSSKSFRGRLAPSPTGSQHLGNARTYLIAWLSARSRGGEIVLRIEDIDSPRVKPWATEQLFDDLRWLGLDWDGPILVQTQRLALYEQALEKLKAGELVYPCACTRGDIERAASAPHLDHEGPVYPGTCAPRQAADSNRFMHRPFAWRMRTEKRTMTWNDSFLGETSLQFDEIGGDFVVWKSAGMPAYQLAVVVDDANQGITEVVRGDDLVPSTPRQLWLYESLGLAPPGFVHVPLVVGPDGRRLAKRHGDARLSTFRAAGVGAEDVIGLLAWSCGWQESARAISARELIPRFTLDSIPRRPFVLEPDLLRQLSH
ncbi:MAG: tRNA glutamyl-Q(34) synthetase GluQRS [Planctomycetes bacterium]|nr:tRNA glutamyl-Q(34) synthetase GluQRS [Planctomycetota bacterium]